MKTLKTLIIFISAWILSGIANAQIFGNDPGIKIENLSPDNVWQVAEMTLVEKGFKTGKYDPVKGTLFSEWLEWTAVTVSNRARLYFVYDGQILTLRIVDRQYKSTKGWAEAVGNLSKKKYEEYVQSVADRINEIKNDPELIRTAIKASKLIPAFSAVNMVGSTEWKLLEVTQHESGSMYRPELKFQVTNKGSKDITLRYYSGGGAFTKFNGTGTARLRVRWDQNETENSVTIRPGESTGITVAVAQGYTLESAIGYVLTMNIEHIENQLQKLKIEIYNIPIPYTYKEGD